MQDLLLLILALLLLAVAVAAAVVLYCKLKFTKCLPTLDSGQ